MAIDTDATPAFSELSLPEPLLRAIDELGFDQCTEIQGLSLPAIASGHDIAAQAQTGTGKTAAFLLGSFARLLAEDGGERQQNQPRMLVLAPTRELAIQIKKDADALGKYTGLTSMVAYGGVDYEKQRKELAAGVDVLIGTPGRLIDYFKQKVFNLKRLEICVLDEADRMFDLGFIADIRYLLRRMPEPEQRTSMLFSATLSHRVMELAYEHMNNPVPIKTEARNVTADGVAQALYHPASDEKIPLLLGLLKEKQPERAIVFVNTKRVAERVAAYLTGNEVACGTLSGDVRQKKRQKILADFTGGSLNVLIATDVAARGLHIDDVTHVFNYDLPQHAEDYVHRIGRTARAGTQGEAVSFVCEEQSQMHYCSSRINRCGAIAPIAYSHVENPVQSQEADLVVVLAGILVVNRAANQTANPPIRTRLRPNLARKAHQLKNVDVGAAAVKAVALTRPLNPLAHQSHCQMAKAKCQQLLLYYAPGFPGWNAEPRSRLSMVSL